MSEHFRRYIKKQHFPVHPHNIKFKTTFKNCVLDALVEREWKQTHDDDWNLMWCDKEQIYWVFENTRIMPSMRVNHFRGWQELCRKDKLSKNLKKFKRGLDKQNNKQESNEYDFLPPTYLLPSEYVVFYEEYKKMQNDSKCLWIMKPTSECQGRGIFIFSKINDIAKWKTAGRDGSVKPYVCQRYLMNPLLLGGRKFDMRIYALCTSYQPLKIYLYRAGFARFAHDRYDNSDIDNLYKHLTNVAININAPNYIKRIGGKWFLQELRKFMLSKAGVEVADNAFADVQRCIIKSLRAVQKLISACPMSFELYGFDFIFDADYKAWLLEVNGGPSMSSNTKEDHMLKVGLIDDTMTLINVEGILKGDDKVVGGFNMIYCDKEVQQMPNSIYTSMLGCKCQREDNLKKLAKTTSYRLAKEYMEKNKNKEQSSKKIDNKFNIRPSPNIDHARPSSNNHIVNVTRTRPTESNIQEASAGEPPSDNPSYSRHESSRRRREQEEQEEE